MVFGLQVWPKNKNSYLKRFALVDAILSFLVLGAAKMAFKALGRVWSSKENLKFCGSEPKIRVW